MLFRGAGVELTIQTPVDCVHTCDGHEHQPRVSIYRRHDTELRGDRRRLAGFLGPRAVETQFANTNSIAPTYGRSSVISGCQTGSLSEMTMGPMGTPVS